MANDSAENETKGPLTAGERLAAQQAAKSARKAAERGRDADLVEEKALAQAAVAKDWLQDNLKPLGLMAGGVLLVAAIGIGWSTFTRGQDAAGGAELAAVLDGVLNDLKQADAPLLPYTQEQTEARLALIDPSLVDTEGIDPRKADEFIRQMNEMLQRQPPEE